MHSDWSDGSQTLAEIVETGLARGYMHSAVTDHSYGLPIAGGLPMERVAQQHREIDALNARYRSRFRLLKGIEANIRADGTVDMTQEELALMEIVVAAPHSALRSTADQTGRMIAAVNTPGVHILGHPRGRIHGSRAGVVADWDRVFDAAARAGVAIEIDGGSGEAGPRLHAGRPRGEVGVPVRARQRRARHRSVVVRRDRARACQARRRATSARDQLLAARQVTRLGRPPNSRRRLRSRTGHRDSETPGLFINTHRHNRLSCECEPLGCNASLENSWQTNRRCPGPQKCRERQNNWSSLCL